MDSANPTADMETLLDVSHQITEYTIKLRDLQKRSQYMTDEEAMYVAEIDGFINDLYRDLEKLDPSTLQAQLRHLHANLAWLRSRFGLAGRLAA